MTALDGRNSNKVPTVITLTDYEIIETYRTYEGRTVICLMIDGLFVPCIENPYTYDNYDWILCAAYKTRRGFNNWLDRQCK